MPEVKNVDAGSAGLNTANITQFSDDVVQVNDEDTFENAQEQEDQIFINPDGHRFRWVPVTIAEGFIVHFPMSVEGSTEHKEP
jgi:hypothetical protein